MKFAKSALETRFGLRILLVFTASAIIPMLILAALAYTSTRDQLEEDALVSLRRDLKSATMSIAEQIILGAAQLDLAAVSSNWQNEDLSHAFSRIERLDGSELHLTPRQHEHLRRGRSLLLVSNREQNGIRLMRAVGDQILVGFFEDAFLYKPERLAEGERYWATDQNGEYLFGVSSDELTRELATPFASVEARVPFDLESPNGVELALVWPLFLNHPYLSPEIRVGMSRTRRSIHGPLDQFRTSFAVALLLGLLGSTGVALNQIRIRVRPLEEILRTTHEIEKGDFSARSNISSGDEFEILGSSINAMAEKLGEDFAVLETLQGVSKALLDAKDRSVVASQVVAAAIQFSGASVGTLLVVDRDSKGPSRSLVEIDESGKMASNHDEENQDRFEFALRAIGSVDFVVALRSREQDQATCQALDEFVGSRVEAALAIPLISGSGDPEGVVQLVFCEATDAALLGLSTRRSLSILAGQAGAALKNIAWIEDLRGLFEGVIRLTVNAIDEKSPYTGDHCRRVPVLAEQIANAVCLDNVGALKDFSLTDQELYELKIAALLHDCGKVVTPVHVMDKATKLETIHDRIELVRIRAEVIRRDLELAVLRNPSESNERTSSHERLRSEELSSLEDDLALIERCNIGGEFMEESLKEQVREISARYRWIDSAGRERSLITDDESMNLQISRGTLNDDEREIINNHVVTTIQLLEELPFPAELRNVPEIAGAHHERVNGTGYPLGLRGKQLSIQARILGLADVFEALIAKTRPYKPGKSLSETLQILENMVEEGQLDRNLHEIFIRQKVYLNYAAEFVDGDQIDEAHQADLEELTASWQT